MSEEKFVQVRLKKPIFDEDIKQMCYQDYVCWIPLDLALKAKETGKTISLYFDSLDEWRNGFVLESRDLSESINKEKTNAMHARNNKWRHFKYAGRSSFKG